MLILPDLKMVKTGDAAATTGENTTYTLTVTNNGDISTPNVIIEDQLPAGVSFVSASNGGIHNSGTHKVTWPTISALAVNASVAYTVIVTPLCAGIPSVTNIATTTSDFIDGNDLDNADTLSQTITDNDPPSITCPGPVNANANTGQCYATGVVLGTPVTSDNCGGSLTVGNNAPTQFPFGETTVTWTVTDTHGNSATCTQVVTVNDNQNPTITCVPNQARNTNNIECTYTTSGTEFDPTAFGDNCPGATITNSYNNLSTSCNRRLPQGSYGCYMDGIRCTWPFNVMYIHNNGI